jgi:hypothetical protein
MVAPWLRGARGLRQHGAMLFVHELDERGAERVLVLPIGSVVSYFTGDEDGHGMVLHVEPGLLAFPWDFEAQRDAVREAVLAEAGRRLQVPSDQVVSLPLAQLKELADPDINRLSLSASRRRSRGRFGPFLR